jgi:hypothetical protein
MDRHQAGHAARLDVLKHGTLDRILGASPAQHEQNMSYA